jgi:transposase
VIALGPAVRAYALARAVDMRRGFEGLWALATQELGREVLGGDLFLFVGKDRRRCKVLYFDGTGLCVLHKRLSKGRFAALWRCSAQAQLQLSLAELQLFLQGCDAVGRIPLSPAPLMKHELRRFSTANELK